MIASLLALHVLSIVIWVGGMFFAWMALRPVATSVLEPPQRLTLWAGVFSRFFPWVTASIVLILVSGYGMIFMHYSGMKGLPLYIHIMSGLAIVMILIYGHVYFAHYVKLRRAVAEQNWEFGGIKLAKIRRLIGLNLIVGLITVAVGAGGRYFVL